MNGDEKLKLTDFLDPITQIALGCAIFSDLLFIIIPIRYILVIIVVAVLWPKMQGLLTKLIFVIGAVLPLPLMTIASVLAVFLSNRFIRGVATSVVIGVATGGVGTLAEAGALAAKTAGQEVASEAATKVVGAVGGEKAGEIAGSVAGAAASKGLSKGGAATKTETSGSATQPKTGTAGPVAQPPEMAGPQAQPEEIGKPSFGERVKRKVIEEGKEKLTEKLAGEELDGNQQDESNIVAGGFGDSDVIDAKLDQNGENNEDNGTVDLRNAA
jgi:hypothetical protein